MACDDYHRVYDDGEVHRVDLEEAGQSMWAEDVDPLTVSTAAVPSKAFLGTCVE